MDQIITAATMSQVLRKALKKGLVHENDDSLIFYDLTYLEEKVKEIKSVFPEDAFHTIAIKANPLIKVLQLLQKQDVGVEAASIGEIYLALKAGFSSQKIVYDSPAKTKSDLLFALKNNIHLNADSFDELDRIFLLKAKLKSTSKIGLRINPQTGEGSIKTTGVAGKYSKFGVPLKESDKKILDYFRKYSDLSGLHVHAGSQGIPLAKLIKSVKAILGLAHQIGKNVNWIDIGGGLAVNYSGKNMESQLKSYTSKLQDQCPQLFNGTYKIITEFGRAVFANTGWTATRVEYVKKYSRTTIIVNVGADLFLRESYQPQFWKHKFSITDNNGNLKSTSHKNPVTIAGPLCFSGDILAENINLPAVNERDFLLIHDSGAYTLSMWSRYNSRFIPKVIGYRDNGASFEVLKEKETPQDLITFWS